MNYREISSKKFDKSAFGYRPDDVDEFFKEVSLSFAQLQKEKEDCEKKIDVLADKVRDYMRDEEVIKEALLGAQRQGRQVIDESQQVSSRIIAEANEKADQIISQTKIQLEKEKICLANMQKEVSDFKAKLLSLYKNHLDLITAMPDADDVELLPEQPHTEEAVHQEEVQDEKSYSSDTKKHNFPFSSPSSSSTDGRYSDLKFGSNSK